MFEVAETTIKRWADENIIPCVKTPGGHRKFSLREVVKFAEKNGYTIGGSQPPPLEQAQIEQLEVGVHTRNYSKIADVFCEEALQADRNGMLMLLLYLYKQHIPFATIVDEVIRPALNIIGTKWDEGTLEINQEHAASQATVESLIRMSSELYHKESNGMTALCACPEGELHEIGLRGVAYSLECEGWNVRYIGANSPVNTLTPLISSTHPELVCLSITVGKQNGQLTQKLRKIASLVHAYRGKVILGGRYAERLEKSTIECDHIAESIEDAVSFSRDVFRLKPGPKKKHTR